MPIPAKTQLKAITTAKATLTKNFFLVKIGYLPVVVVPVQAAPTFREGTAVARLDDVAILNTRYLKFGRNVFEHYFAILHIASSLKISFSINGVLPCKARKTGTRLFSFSVFNYNSRRAGVICRSIGVIFRLASLIFRRASVVYLPPNGIST